MRKNKYTKWFLGSIAILSLLTMGSCADEPDKYEIEGGIPTLKYIRPLTPEVSDSLLTGAYMSNSICLVGDNLRSIVAMYFNDQKAVLNTSYMTDHTVIVDVPKEIPTKVTDKIYMITKSSDTITYDFKVLVPSPSVNTMSCEYAKPGSEATIYGDYFIDDENVPLKITMAENVPVTKITKITKTAVSFIVPDNAPSGYINVKSIYGTSRSKFQYADKRNILFDWDGSHGGMATGHGWRNGVIKNNDPIESIDGSYLYFGGASMLGAIGGTWAEDNFCVNYWPEPNKGYPELSSLPEFEKMIKEYGVNNLQVKFEAYVPTSNPWMSSALQVIFSGNSDVTFATAGNAYYGKAELPRGLWMPWKDNGTYNTADKWITVSIKFADFNKKNDGSACSTAFSKNMLTGLTLFVWHGGLAGTDCNPVICIDNIRVVPVE